MGRIIAKKKLHKCSSIPFSQWFDGSEHDTLLNANTILT